MNKKCLAAPLIAAAALLNACAAGSGGSSSLASEGSVEAIDITSTIDALRLGFRMEGTLVVTESYFDDSSFQIPSSVVDDVVTTYAYAFVYENADDYTGVDRRFYKVETDNEGNQTRSYVMGENSFDDSGYAGILWLDYDNTVVEGYAVDSNGDRIPYGNNGLLNPFTLTRYEDFSGVGNEFRLGANKTNIIAGNWFSTLEEWQSNLSYAESTFYFDEDEGLVSAHLSSNRADDSSPSTVRHDGQYYSLYCRRTYEIDISFSEIGTASSRALVAPEESKPENAPLANALDNMAGEEIVLKRRIAPYQDGKYVGYDPCANFYYMGSDQGIYSQSYNLYEGDEEPTAPTANDFLLRSVTAGGVLRVYQLNDTTGLFERNSSDYTNLDGLYYYGDLAYDLSYLSADIFTLNEDGSYSPNEDNIPYIAREVFMSSLDTFSPVDSGYVSSVNVYVNDEQTCIDRIEVAYDDGYGNSGLMTLAYDGLGSGTPSFAIETA